MQLQGVAAAVYENFPWAGRVSFARVRFAATAQPGQAAAEVFASACCYIAAAALSYSVSRLYTVNQLPGRAIPERRLLIIITKAA